MDRIHDAEDDGDDRVLLLRLTQFGDVLQMMLQTVRGQAVAADVDDDADYDEMLYSKNKKRKEQQDQVNNENKVQMIVAARIELLPLRIPYQQKSGDDGSFLH